MDKTERILNMLEHPERYSEKQIQEILAEDECRELYETMRLCADAFEMEDAHTKLAHGLKEKEWKRLSSASHRSPLTSQASGALRASAPPFAKREAHPLYKKIAAAIVGVLMLSGIAYATMHLWTSPNPSEEEECLQTEDTVRSSSPLESPEEVTDSIPQTRIFENVPLDEMVKELAVYYQKVADIQSPQAHELRLFYKWNRKDKLEDIINDLNHFDRVSLTIQDDKLIVKP